jgi:hypothetical protein
MNSQKSARIKTSNSMPSVAGGRLEQRFTKSQLRDPKVLELATRGLVEIMTGGENTVAMLPWQSLIDMESVLDCANSFIQLTMVAGRSDIPRALLGGVAFFADLSSEDQERFLSDFAEALAESIRLGDPRPATFLVDGYRIASGNQTLSNPIFSGEVSEEVRLLLASKLPVR